MLSFRKILKEKRFNNLIQLIMMAMRMMKKTIVSLMNMMMRIKEITLIHNSITEAISRSLKIEKISPLKRNINYHQIRQHP